MLRPYSRTAVCTFSGQEPSLISVMHGRTRGLIPLVQAKVLCLNVLMPHKFILLLAFVALLCAACTGTPTPFDLPTLAVLPSLTPQAPAVAVESTAVASTTASTLTTTTPGSLEAVATITLPVPTEQLQVWYTSAATAVYACPETTCDVLTNFPAGVQLFVIVTENGWHEILLARQRGRYVEARLTTQVTPQPLTATAASAQIVSGGGGSVPPGAIPTGQAGPPTASIDELPPDLIDLPRATQGPTPTFDSVPPITGLPTIPVTPPFGGLPPGAVISGTATPANTLFPPNVTGAPTATFILPNVTIAPITPSATPRSAPPGVDPNLPTATPYNPRPPGV